MEASIRKIDTRLNIQKLTNAVYKPLRACFLIYQQPFPDA
jgi:hypothetical protein